MRWFAEGDKLSAVYVNSLLKAQSGTGVGIGGEIGLVSGDDVYVHTGAVLRKRASVLEIIPSSTSYSGGTRDATNPRRNLIIYDVSAGTIGRVDGTPAVIPECPALSDNEDIVLAEIYLPQTAGGSMVIYDARAFVPKPCCSTFFEEYENTDETNLWEQRNSTNPGTFTFNTNTVFKMIRYNGGGEWCAHISRFAMPSSSMYYSALWLRGFVKFHDNVSNKYVGFWKDTAGQPYIGGAGEAAVFFWQNTDVWSLSSIDGGSPTTQNGGSTDTSWHKFDLVVSSGASGRAGLWVDGVFSVQLTSVCPTDFVKKICVADEAGGTSGMSFQHLELLHSSF